MTIPFKKPILRGVALAAVAAIGYTGYMLSRLAPVATGYAAKALCSGVYVSGRPAASVIDIDIMAGVHPLLKLVRPSNDPDHHRDHGVRLRHDPEPRQHGCMHGPLGEPELILVNPESIVQLAAISLPAGGATMLVWRERIEVEQRAVARTAATLAREQCFSIGHI